MQLKDQTLNLVGVELQKGGMPFKDSTGVIHLIQAVLNKGGDVAATCAALAQSIAPAAAATAPAAKSA